VVLPGRIFLAILTAIAWKLGKADKNGDRINFVSPITLP
jgi:hypothetical protein